VYTIPTIVPITATRRHMPSRLSEGAPFFFSLLFFVNFPTWLAPFSPYLLSCHIFFWDVAFPSRILQPIDEPSCGILLFPFIQLSLLVPQIYFSPLIFITYPPSFLSTPPAPPFYEMPFMPVAYLRFFPAGVAYPPSSLSRIGPLSLFTLLFSVHFRNASFRRGLSPFA